MDQRLIRKILLGSLLGWWLAGHVARADDFEFFEKKIRPLLVDNCYSCHSATAPKVKGGLLLDTKEGLLKGGDTGPAIVPGDPETSLLIKAVRYTDKDLQMPPKDKRLSGEQVADLVAWVKMGARDPRVSPAKSAAAQPPPYDFAAARKMWAFQKPVDPPVPKVKNSRWAKSPIDDFILARLEGKKLSPAPAADKRTLIRRATYDLTGLPPTQKETEDFLKDSSNNAFAKVIDRLLASPRYGERWGRHWLDVVRYTDSLDSRVTGGDADISEAYRYRDWVVKAFNDDLPYNQFIREQIAGDILQPKDLSAVDTNSIIATGMYAIGNWGNGDADKDKILTDIADDQVDVTGRAFLGLTLACARCHDHKFDPIPTQDYYSLAGIFFSSHILPKLTPKGAGENLLFIPLASKAELASREKRDARMAELDKSITAISDQQLAELAKTVLKQSASYLRAIADYQNRPPEKKTMTLAEFDAKQTGHAELQPVLLQQWFNYLGFGDQQILTRITHDFSGKPGLNVLRNAANTDTPSGLINTTDQAIAFSTITMPPRSVAIHPSPKAGVAVGWNCPVTGTFEITGRVADADPNCGDGIDWKLEMVRNRHTDVLASGAIPNGGQQPFSEGTNAASLFTVKLIEGDVVHLVIGPKGDYSCDATVVDLNLVDRDNPKLTWNLTRDVIAHINDQRNPFSDRHGNPGVWSIFDMESHAPMGEVAAGSLLAKWFDATKHESKVVYEIAGENIWRALQAPDVTNSSVSKLYGDILNPKSAFWSDAADFEKSFPEDALASLKTERTELTSLRDHAPPALLKTHGLQEGGVPESPHAGLHDVKVHLRGRYDHLGEEAPRRFPRLLAGDAQKPITEGSGRLALADWIASADNPLTARVMVNRLWQHHFGEGIVRTPNNYGKLGTPPTHPELLDYLAHRFIDSGWSIKAMQRAIMLSATYQQSSTPAPATLRADPDNLWFGRMNRRRLESEALRDSLLMDGGTLDPAMGGLAIRDLNTLRRTLYVMTIRSDRATYQFLFDAADPNAIVEKRIDSTVAPQALFLLNNPFVLTQTKALAQRTLKEAPADDPGRIRWLYRLLYDRPPDKQELAIGLKSISRARATNADYVDAWDEYCQVLVCANEFIYVD